MIRSKSSVLFAGLALSLACCVSQALAQVTTGPIAPSKLPAANSAAQSPVQPGQTTQADLANLPVNPQNLLTTLRRIDPNMKILQSADGYQYYEVSVLQNGRTYHVIIGLNSQTQVTMIYSTLAELSPGQTPPADKLAALLRLNAQTLTTYFSLRTTARGNTLLEATHVLHGNHTIGRFVAGLNQFLQGLDSSSGVWANIS